MVRFLLVLFTCILYPFPSFAQGLEQYLWTHRILLIESANEQHLLEQKQILADHQDGFDERDFVVITRDRNDTAFFVTLIGKDGGEKARWDLPVSSAEVFAIVDAMPMRQREMREQQ